MQFCLPTWLGSYQGSDFSLEDYELKVLEKIPEKSRSSEAECLRNRWFDYARLHPMQATYYFVSCFNKVYQALGRKYFAATMIRRPELAERHLKTFWTLRQICDLNGWKYGWFCLTMLDYRLTSGEFKNHMPQPCHLMKQVDEEVRALNTLWEAYIGAQMAVSIDPWFSVRSWCGHPKQRAHEDFLVAQVKKKATKHFTIADLIYKRQVLRLERAIQEFPDEVCQAQRDASIIASINS